METLKPYRNRIDDLDDRIIDLLAERMGIVRAVGVIKAREGLNTIQPARVVEVQERCAARAHQKGLNPHLVRKIYTLIIDEAHEMEQSIAAQSGSDPA